MANHLVLGKGTFPAVGYFEIVLQEWLSHDSSPLVFPLTLSQAVFPSPLWADEEELSVDVWLEREGDDTLFRVEKKGDEEPETCARGRIRGVPPSTGDANTIDIADAIDMGTVAKGLTQMKRAKECYAIFDRMGIGYQDLFRSISSFQCNDKESLCRIACQGDEKGFRLNPGFLDGALQCALLQIFSCLDPDRVYVPFSMEGLMLRQKPLRTGVVHASLKEGSKEKGFFVFDLFMAKRDGTLIGTAREVCFKAFSRESKAPAWDKASPGIETWAVAATFTAEPIQEPLAFWQRKIGKKGHIAFAPYNQVFQELLDPESLLSRNALGVNIVLFRPEDFRDRTRTGLPRVPDTRREKALAGAKQWTLPNGMAIAHLNTYETQYLYNEIFVEKTYLKQGIVLPEDAVVVDIGANIGMFSLFVASQCPRARIFSFEPSPITFDALQRNLSLYVPGARALNCGVAGKEGEAEFTFYPRSSVFSGFHTDEEADGEALKKAMANEIGSRSLAGKEEEMLSRLDAMVRDRLEKQTFSCRLCTLSGLVAEHGLERIDLLKIDAEKCEWEILSAVTDADWERIAQVVVEVHDSTGDLVVQVQSLLAAKGFLVSSVEEDLLQSSGLYNIYGTRPRKGQTRDLSPIGRGIEKNVDELAELIRAFSQKSQIPLVLGICPPSPAALAEFSQDFLSGMAAGIEERLKGLSQVACVRFSEFQDLYQWAEPHDEFRDRTGRIPYTPEFFTAMATLLTRRIFLLNREPVKVIALDCDNTLWKGVVGEQGTEGITIGPGYTALQQFVKERKDRGMLLCLASKNSEEDVQPVFFQRKDMVLKWEDITAAKVNWELKSQNLAELAKDLNLGLDSFVFLDDSPVECAEVRAQAPQVLTLQVPSDAEQIPRFLSHIWVFDQEGGTAEDARRTEMYRQNMAREQFRKNTLSFSDFLEGLQLDIQVNEATESDFERVSQLTQRTNQFNFVKQPRDTGKIASLLDEPGKACLVVRVADRFGDYGLCGVMIFDEAGAKLVLDSFLLSCRVLGRGVEHRMLSWLGQKAVDKGIKEVCIPFVPTPKNTPARKFLDSVGKASADGNDEKVQYLFSAASLKELTFTPPKTALEKGKKDAGSKRSRGPIQEASQVMQEIATHLNSLDAIHEAIQTERRAGKAQDREVIREKTSAWPGDNMEGALVAQVRQILLDHVTDLAPMGAPIPDPDRPFTECGIDSLLGIDLIVLLNRDFGLSLPTTVLFDYTSVNELCAYLCTDFRNQVGKRLEKQVAKQLEKEREKKEAEVQEEPSPPFASLEAPSDSGYALQAAPRERDLEETFALESGFDGELPLGLLVQGPGKTTAIQTVPLHVLDPGPDEIQIAVMAASLNFSDLLSVKGLYPMMPPYPFVPGSDASGMVTAVGKEVRHFKKGDAVVAVMDGTMGGHAALVNTRACYAVKKPENISFEAACALPFTFLTVYYALERAGLKSGESILIQTAAGGVGLCAVQAARQKKGRVFATVGSDEKKAFLERYGVSHVIQYKKQDFKEEILELTQGRGVDVVLNTLGGDAIQKGLDILSPGGRYIEIALAGLKGAKGLDLSALTQNQQFISVNVRTWIETAPDQVQKALEQMASLASQGLLTAHMDRTFGFSRIQEAYQHLENAANIGKVVVCLPHNKAARSLIEEQRAIPKPIWGDPGALLEEVAIVGMSGPVFPEPRDISAFWQMLRQGKTGTGPVPRDRWDADVHFHPDPGMPDKTYSRWGGFLEDAGPVRRPVFQYFRKRSRADGSPAADFPGRGVSVPWRTQAMPCPRTTAIHGGCLPGPMTGITPCASPGRACPGRLPPSWATTPPSWRRASPISSISRAGPPLWTRPAPHPLRPCTWPAKA